MKILQIAGPGKGRRSPFDGMAGWPSYFKAMTIAHNAFLFEQMHKAIGG